jgi:hypothetical protein
MTRREFTHLDSGQVANEVIEMVAARIARRFPALSPLELVILFADVRDEIEAGLDEFRFRRRRVSRTINRRGIK